MIKLEGYEITDTIYEGKKSSIYRGRKGTTKVIIKVLTSQYPLPEDILRFKREADFLLLFDSPYIVKLYNTENYNNIAALVEEDIEGKALSVNVSEAMPPGKFLEIAIKSVEALDEIHKKNIIHKDIKPHNIVYQEETGRLQIIDFGSASQLSKENPVLINTGALEGTLSYVSPEQTGRMNRNIDYRTDFYSLGVTFYQLLTGSLPFTSKDSIELIHCHIAIQPTPPAEKFGAIAKTLSDIIMKLLAKTPEDRYQSCSGLLADLEECRRQFLTSGKIGEFTIGQSDVSSKFQIPEKLYGRESEIQILLNAFDRVSTNEKSEMILIAGSSGMGKSALIQELYKPITKNRGYFILGKFDQFKRDLPYNAIIQAFTELTRQILTESEESVKKWKEEILSALGANAGVMTELISELELLLGKQEVPTELPPTEAQNRFNNVTTSFVKVFATSEHPLALFLDDMQWADSASLKLLKLFYTDYSIGSLFLICSYRDNEVDAVHPFSLLLDEIKKENRTVELLRLSPLRTEHLSQLLVDTLFCSLQSSEELAQIVHAKTGGNPFFATELLKTLYNEDLITQPVLGEKGWKWDLAKIKSVKISDNVVELMAVKIEKLSPDTIAIMKLASCIGAKFYLDNLSVISGKEESEVMKDLTEAINEGMILIGGGIAKFAHDRVREATYSLISVGGKVTYHHKIGRLLLENTPPELLEDRIFNILGQLNLGKSLINSFEEQLELVRLNLKAGKKAKTSTAYDAALNFLKEGEELLPKEDKWEKYYELCLEVYRELAECEYLAGHFAEADKLYEYILQNTKTVLDKIPIIHIQLRQKTSEVKTEEAFQIGFNVLRELGVEMPDLANGEAVQGAFFAQLNEYKLLLAERPIHSLFDLPRMSDRNMMEAISMITNLGDIAIVQKQELLGLMSILGVNLSLKHGNANVSPISFVMWGVINCLGFKDYNSGYELGQLSLKLNQEKFPDNLILGKILAFYVWNINHYKKHTSKDIEMAQKGYEVAMANSDLVYASYSIVIPLKVSFNIGLTLDDVIEYGKKCIFFADKYKQMVSVLVGNSTLMAALALQGKTENPTSLNCNVAMNGTTFNEDTYIKNFTPYGQPMVYFYLRKFQLCYLFGDYDKCLEILPDVEKYFPNLPAHIAYTEFYFYKALLFLAIDPSSDEEEKKQREEKFTEAHGLLKLWSEHCEDNFLHQFLLVEAEKARVEGRYFEAEQLYEKSIQSARKYEYTNNAAIASELAAKFYISKGLEKLASVYLKDAHYLYTLWGATAKVKKLTESYPDIFRHLQQSQETRFSTTVSSDSTANATGTTTTGSSFLDLNTVMKASQAISGEIQLGKLLEKMMVILFENAGAERGFFILKDKGKWLIQADGHANSNSISVMQARDMNAIGTDKQELSLNIVNYVIRTKSIILLNDAANKGMFVNDTYIQATKPKSILCYPVINQGNLVGIVYLENNLTTDAFTPDRVEILKILSSQIAVSVENSLLYANLEEKVEERTRDLNQALVEVRGLKEQQDGDYFLNTLLIEPLGQNNAFSKNVDIEFFIKQKKNFLFRKREYELGGDINISENIELQGKKYIVFLNADAMGKSIQGAGGVIVLGTVFKSILQRTISTASGKNVYPERWLKNAFIEMHKSFESFDGSMLMSLVFGLVDEVTGTMYFMNAEHPDIVLYRDGEASFIENPNQYRKLGTQGQSGNICVEVFSLRPDDVIILGSDGRDDIILGKDPNTGKDIINMDENLFLTHVKKGDGELEKIYEEIKNVGKAMDDLSLLKIHYKGVTADQEMLDQDLKLLEDYKEIGKFDKYTEIGEKVISNYPHLTNFLYEMSFAYKELGQYEKAIDYGERLRLRDAKNTANLLNLVESYHGLGKKERAKSILDACLKARPDDVRFLKLKEVIH